MHPHTRVSELCQAGSVYTNMLRGKLLDTRKPDEIHAIYTASPVPLHTVSLAVSLKTLVVLRLDAANINI